MAFFMLCMLQALNVCVLIPIHFLDLQIQKLEERLVYTSSAENFEIQRTSERQDNKNGNGSGSGAEQAGSTSRQPIPDIFRWIGPWIAGTAGEAFQQLGRGPGYPWHAWLSGGVKQEEGDSTLVRKRHLIPYRQAEMKVLHEASLPSEDAEMDADASTVDDIWELTLNQRLRLAVSWMRGLRSE